MAEISTDTSTETRGAAAAPVPHGADSVVKRLKRRANGHSKTDPASPTAVSPNNEQQQAQSFFDELRQMPEEEWDRLGWRLYIYRRWPRIMKSDEPHYLDCVRHAIDEASLLETYGSGRYTIRLNNARKTIKTHVCEVHSLDKPPKLDLAELVDCEENRRYFELWPERKAGKEVKANGASGGDAVASELTRLIGKLVEQQRNGQQSAESEKITTTLVNWALGQTAEERKAERDGESPSKLTELVRAIKELSPPPPPPQSDPLALVDRVLSIVEKLRPASTVSAAADPLESLEKAIDLITKVRDITGAPEPPPINPVPPSEDTWQEVGRLVVEVLKPAMPFLGQGLSERLFRPSQPTTPAPTARPPSAAPPSTAPQPAPPSAAVPPAAPTPTATAAPAATAAANPIAAAAMEMDINERTQLFNIAIFAAYALNLGMLGGEFADRCCGKFGGDAYDAFIEHFDKTTLVEKFKSIPEAWQLLAAHEGELTQFVDDFYAYAEDEPDDEPEKPESAHKPLAAKGKKPTAAKEKKVK